jgi:hypothetical protein
MIWFILFLLGILCAIVCVAALFVWLWTGALLGLLKCIERSLTNLGGGHVIVGLLYLIPASLLLSALLQGICLACSFYTAVLR